MSNPFDAAVAAKQAANSVIKVTSFTLPPKLREKYNTDIETVEIRELTLADELAAAKEAEVTDVGAAGLMILSVAQSFVGTNGKRVPELERRKVYDSLPVGIRNLCQRAFARVNYADVDDAEAFLESASTSMGV